MVLCVSALKTENRTIQKWHFVARKRFVICVCKRIFFLKLAFYTVMCWVKTENGNGHLKRIRNSLQELILIKMLMASSTWLKHLPILSSGDRQSSGGEI